MTAQELARYIGKHGTISTQLGTIKIPVLVRDAKELHGRIYLSVVPLGDSEGEAWVDRGQVTINGGF